MYECARYSPYPIIFYIYQKNRPPCHKEDIKWFSKTIIMKFKWLEKTKILLFRLL